MRAPLRMAACAAAISCALPAHAALVENLTTSVVAMALGNAVTADPPGIDSVHFNPAGLARLEGDLTQHTAFGASIRAHAVEFDEHRRRVCVRSLANESLMVGRVEVEVEDLATLDRIARNTRSAARHGHRRVRLGEQIEVTEGRRRYRAV